ncbi:divergent PAP2 family protein [Aneurinibacillus terranovensis]|uniref:divergent PAP2 family protein n=1 Tax=Aneurinibacillus terranovensis TaxID=278991 RepID=UPI000414BA29|nr:divergent PAP2 family protein [Aneurinibacillus terranovensis]
MHPLFSNFPLWSAMLAIVLAQAVKIPITYFTTRKWDMKLLFSTGGMPSSHSAAVTALTTAVGFVDGVGSSAFAISVVFAVIVMFDAAGVRRHAGTHAAVLNLLVEDFQQVLNELKTLRVKPRREQAEKLKELLGHQPSEVLIGGWLGIIQSTIIYYLIA